MFLVKFGIPLRNEVEYNYIATYAGIGIFGFESEVTYSFVIRSAIFSFNLALTVLQGLLALSLHAFPQSLQRLRSRYGTKRRD